MVQLDSPVDPLEPVFGSMAGDPEFVSRQIGFFTIK